MSSKPNKTSEFLEAMRSGAQSANESLPQTEQPETMAKTQRKQAGQKHIGGYFEQDTVEKVAVLKARLALDNSALLKLAIEDLYRKHEAKRAFGDA